MTYNIHISYHFSSPKCLINTSMIAPRANSFSKSISPYPFTFNPPFALFIAIFLQHLDTAHNTISKYSPHGVNFTVFVHWLFEHPLKVFKDTVFIFAFFNTFFELLTV